MAGSIKELIQAVSRGGMSGVVVGTVTRETPVQVQLDDDEQIIMSAASLIIPSGKRSLIKKDEKLYLLSFSDNKMYYLLDRV